MSNEELFKQALVEGVSRHFDKIIEQEKQIGEMAKIFCGMKNGCDGCMWNKVYCNERYYAEEIYKAGYRKRSEGEWIGNDQTDEYICSLCGGIAPVDCEKERFYKSNFCPNCGAKMTRKEDEGK